MRLDDQVRKSLYRYPTLYRVVGNPRLSRLLVLDHLFCTIGNGYEWHPTGYLAEWDRPTPYGQETFPELPDGFFERRDLFRIETHPNRAESLNEYLHYRGDFWYRRDDETTTFIVAADESEILPLIREYGRKQDSQLASLVRKTREALTNDQKTNLRRDTHALFRAENDGICGRPPDLHVYPMCEYSALVEMTLGRTNSPHIPNFALDGIVRPDWVAGGIEIAREILAYYADPQRSQHDFHHPSQPDNRTAGVTWDEYVTAQTRICREFLAKFAPADPPH